MIYTDLTEKAMKICFEAHKDQRDKAGLPYVFHPFHLADQMNDEITATVALLHDAVEDSDYTFDDLRKEGFPQQVLEALALLTHDDDTPYMEYVAKIKTNEISKTVKLADLAHNSDISRIKDVTQADRERLEKYKKARELLLG